MCEQPLFWFFTFGSVHTHPVTGESLAGKGVRFEGTYRGAREAMLECFGRQWAQQYASGPGPTGIIENANGRN